MVNKEWGWLNTNSNSDSDKDWEWQGKKMSQVKNSAAVVVYTLGVGLIGLILLGIMWILN
jgi:hypothetical protein